VFFQLVTLEHKQFALLFKFLVAVALVLVHVHPLEDLTHLDDGVGGVDEELTLQGRHALHSVHHFNPCCHRVKHFEPMLFTQFVLIVLCVGVSVAL